jgi:hypothetical protein
MGVRRDVGRYQQQVARLDLTDVDFAPSRLCRAERISSRPPGAPAPNGKGMEA